MSVEEGFVAEHSAVGEPFSKSESRWISDNLKPFIWENDEWYSHFPNDTSHSCRSMVKTVDRELGPVHLNINLRKLEDEWFLISSAVPIDGHKYWKCDQFEAVKKFVRENGIEHSPD